MIVWSGRLESWALCLPICVSLSKSLPFFGPLCPHLYNEQQVISEGPPAWIPDVIFSIMFLISPPCPPGLRPPGKRQDTGFSPNPSFSWSLASDQEVGKQDFLWGCSLWPRQFWFGKQRGDKEHHPGFEILTPLSVGLMFSSIEDFELLKNRECVIQSWRKICWYLFEQILLFNTLVGKTEYPFFLNCELHYTL